MLIKKYQPADEAVLQELVNLWHEVNCTAHSFISADYWGSQKETVLKLLPSAELFYIEIDEIIAGFIGLNQNYIEGLFVRETFQKKGVGFKLIEYVKQLHSQLSLSVYQKNEVALRFYQRQNFKIIGEKTDTSTSETEYILAWKMSEDEEGKSFS